VNLAELLSAVRDQGGFDVTEAVATGWINDRQAALVARAKYLQKEVSLGTTVSGQGEYSLPDVANIVDLEGVLVGSEPYERVGTRSLWERKFRGGTGNVFAPDFTSAGALQIELYPAPNEDGTAISGLAAVMPDALLAAEDVPVVPPDFHKVIVDGAMAIGLERIDERLDEADRYHQLFETGVQELIRRRNSRIGSGPVQIQVAGKHF
jgi:hypothetical protein